MDRIRVTYKNVSVTLGYGIEDHSYQTLLEELHPEYKWFHGVGGDYQGEWWSAGVNSNGQWAIQEGSFGSCSGCDWLQGVDGEADAIELMKQIDCITLLPEGEMILPYLYKSMDNAPTEGKSAIIDLVNEIRKEMVH